MILQAAKKKKNPPLRKPDPVLNTITILPVIVLLYPCPSFPNQLQAVVAPFLVLQLKDLNIPRRLPADFMPLQISISALTAAARAANRSTNSILNY